MPRHKITAHDVSDGRLFGFVPVSWRRDTEMYATETKAIAAARRADSHARHVFVTAQGSEAFYVTDGQGIILPYAAAIAAAKKAAKVEGEPYEVVRLVYILYSPHHPDTVETF